MAFQWSTRMLCAQLQRSVANRAVIRSFSQSSSRHVSGGGAFEYVRRTWFGTNRRFYYTKAKKSGVSGQALAVALGSSAFMIGAGIFFFGQPEEGLDGQAVVDEFSQDAAVKGYARRCWHRMKEFKKLYTEPAHETLLPAPLPPEYQPPYTVLLEMKDVLVHSEYDRKDGWRLRKRPGVEYLLRSLVGLYEVVLFTSELPYVAQPVVAKLDQDGIIMYHLYRDSTKYENGVHVKDLTNLNRELSRVVIVDTNPASIANQPSNGLLLKEWVGEHGDTTLFDLAIFLRTVAEHKVIDVRHVLDHYKSQGGDVLATFRLNQQRLSEEEKRKEEEKKEKKRASRGAPSGQRWGGMRWS